MHNLTILLAALLVATSLSACASTSAPVPVGARDDRLERPATVNGSSGRLRF
jgi:hypothetical protein